MLIFLGLIDTGLWARQKEKWPALTNRPFLDEEDDLDKGPRSWGFYFNISILRLCANFSFPSTLRAVRR